MVMGDWHLVGVSGGARTRAGSAEPWGLGPGNTDERRSCSRAGPRAPGSQPRSLQRGQREPTVQGWVAWVSGDLGWNPRTTPQEAAPWRDCRSWGNGFGDVRFDVTPSDEKALTSPFCFLLNHFQRLIRLQEVNFQTQTTCHPQSTGAPAPRPSPTPQCRAQWCPGMSLPGEGCCRDLTLRGRGTGQSEQCLGV